MEITVIRHAETIDNLLGICQGQTEGHLSSHGIEQASEAHNTLLNECFDTIFTSDLERAVESCNIIFVNNETEIVKDKRLRERDFGHLQGEAFSEEINYNGDIEGTESMEDMFKRVEDFFAYIKREHYNKRIAVVSHGFAIKVMLSICEQKDIREIETPANCAILRLNI